MAKYVGKRVVPKHCGAWTKNREYEMLSIVLDEASGESYISRRVVPAGTLLTDEYYWSICSLFSQQIADMGEEFEERQTQISQNNAETLHQIRADNDATETAIRQDNDATEQAINQDNSNTRQHVDTTVAEAIANLSAGRAQMNATNEALTARMDAIVGGATDDTEILDARVDFRNKTHENLGLHLRTIEKELKDEHEEMFVYSRNLLDVSAMIPGYFVNQLSGRIEGNAGHSVTDLLEVKPNTTFTYSTKFNLYGSLRVAFYDGEKNFISGVFTDTTFTSPANAVYMRLSDMTSYLEDNAQLEYGSERTDYVPYSRRIDSSLIQSYTKDETDALVLAVRNRKIEPGNTTFFWASQNLFDKNAVIRGYFIHQGTGEIQENAAHVCTDFIEVDPNTDYTFSGDLGQALRYAFYTKNGGKK